MSINREENYRKRTVIAMAHQMAIAARTAPKAKGKNTLEIIVLTENDIINLADKLHKMGLESTTDFYIRDAENLKQSDAVLLIGTKIETRGLNEICQLCGFENCHEKEKHPLTPCVFNTGDLNLAVGSAVSLAANLHVDNRVMFSVGKAAIAAGIFEQDIKIALGIPLSATSKNPFFDRPLQNK